MLQERDLLLITGIPETGKTTYGDNFAKEFGFLHHDLEDNQTRNRFNESPVQFIGEHSCPNYDLRTDTKKG